MKSATAGNTPGERTPGKNPSRFKRPVRSAAAFALLAGVLFMTACSSRYVKNRVNDAKDIFTLEVQTKAYGLSARVGPVKAGFYYKSPSGAAAGLRGGEWGKQHTAEFAILFFGADYHDAEPLKDLLPKKKKARKKKGRKSDANDKSGDDDAPESDGKKKKERSDNLLMPGFPLPGGGASGSRGGAPGGGLPGGLPGLPGGETRTLRLRRKNFRARSPFGTKQSAWKTSSLFRKKEAFVSAHYFTQLEVSIGLYGGVKIGFNPGELLDFLLGFIGIDIYNDDAPYDDPRIEKLKKSPFWKTLDPERKKRLLRQYRKFQEKQNP